MPIAAILLLHSLAQLPPPADSLERDRVVSELGTRLDARLTRFAAYGFAGSVLVARGGEVVLLKGYGQADVERGVPNSAATRFEMNSMTKTPGFPCSLASSRRSAAKRMSGISDATCSNQPQCRARCPERSADGRFPLRPRLRRHARGLQPGPPNPYVWGTVGVGGVWCTVGDMYRWVVALRERRMLGEEEWRTLTTPTQPPAMEAFGWHVETTPDGRARISKDGGSDDFASQLLYYPRDDVVIVWASNNLRQRWRQTLNQHSLPSRSRPTRFPSRR